MALRKINEDDVGTAIVLFILSLLRFVVFVLMIPAFVSSFHHAPFWTLVLVIFVTLTVWAPLVWNCFVDLWNKGDE